MKKLLLIALSVMIISLGLTAQNQNKEDKEMMKKWMKYSTPNENHKALEYFAGKWNVTSEMWMKPGDESIKSGGTYISEMILGGRFLHSKMTGTSMGMPFEGLSITGYDNLHGKYVGYWIDSMGTGIFPVSGTLDKTGRVRTDTGEWDDFITGGKSKVKMVTTIISSDRYKFEMYMILPDGKEFKSLKMEYSRISDNRK